MKFCPTCGKELIDEAEFCTGCGCAVQNKQKQPQPATDGLATAAKVFLIIGCIKVCALLFVNMIAGILLLCRSDNK